MQAQIVTWISKKIGILTGFGFAISPELAEQIIALAVSAFGIVELVRNEKKQINSY